MIYYDLNFLMLMSWRTAHAFAGSAMQTLFGLSAEEIAAVGAADEAEIQRWSAIATPLVRPRPGLLPALRANRRATIMGFIADTRGPGDSRAIVSWAQEANHLLLTRWWRAVHARENVTRFELDEADVHALARRSPELLQAWATLPFAIAVPKRGLIGALHRRSNLHLLAFASPWEHADDQPQTLAPPSAGRGPRASARRAAPPSINHAVMSAHSAAARRASRGAL
jgi:hypothetical protein